MQCSTNTASIPTVTKQQLLQMLQMQLLQVGYLSQDDSFLLCFCHLLHLRVTASVKQAAHAETHAETHTLLDLDCLSFQEIPSD